MAEPTLPIHNLLKTDAALLTLPSRFFAYVKAHERLIIVVAVLVFGWFTWGKVESIIAAHDEKKYSTEKAQLVAQANANASLAQQLAKSNDDLKALTDQYAQQNAALEQQNIALAAKLSNQQAKDKTLPPPELAQRVETLASLAPNSVVPAPGETFTVTNPALGQIAATLEEVPVLQTELTNTQAQRDNNATLLDKERDNSSKKDQLIGGLNLQLVDADKTCKAEIKVEVDKVKKSRRKWFIAGFVLGVATRFAKYL